MRATRTVAFILSASAGINCSGADLQRMVDASPLAQRAHVGIHVVDLKTGKTVFARNENRFFLPASNLKLFTSALALEKLGADYRFTTRIVLEDSGDLALVGSGDPTMNGRAYPYQPGAQPGSPLGAIEELADQAVANGLKRLDGDVIGDDRLYPWSPYPPSWTQDDTLRESGAPVSALSVADNVVTISVAPAPKTGEPALLAIEPALEYFAIDNRVLTTARSAGSNDAQIRVARPPGSRQILLSGRIPARHTAVRELAAVDDPAFFAACALYDALTRRGVVITGRPAARHRTAESKYAEPAGRTLATRVSPPLAQVLQVLNKVSENLHAELALRAAGGLAALNAFLTQIGASPGDSRIDDGSGLSRNDEVTPKLVTRLLAYMYRSPERETWISLLPVGGEDGTLSHQLCCTSDARRIHAKTGTLARSMALSGYAQSKTQGWLAFTILVNDFAAPSPEVQAWIDKIAIALVE